MTVTAATKRDLAAIAERDPALASSALAASALTLANRMDSRRSSPTAIASCARALADTLEQLRALIPPTAKGDGLDDIAAQRAKRRAAASS